MKLTSVVRRSIVTLMVAAVVGCTAAPRVRPVKGGDVNEGAGSITQARKFLQGRWSLESFEVFPPGKRAITLKGSGMLNYDEFGNLRIEIRADDQVAQLLRAAGIDIQDGKDLVRRTDDRRHAEPHAQLHPRRPGRRRPGSRPVVAQPPALLGGEGGPAVPVHQGCQRDDPLDGTLEENAVARQRTSAPAYRLRQPQHELIAVVGDDEPEQHRERAEAEAAKGVSGRAKSFPSRLSTAAARGVGGRRETPMKIPYTQTGVRRSAGVLLLAAVTACSGRQEAPPPAAATTPCDGGGDSTRSRRAHPGNGLTVRRSSGSRAPRDGQAVHRRLRRDWSSAA